MSNDDEINGESPDAIDEADTDTCKFLRHVGFTAQEAALIVNDPAVHSGNLPLIAITRIVDRVAAMEAYLRAKIASDRSGRIITPYKN